MNAKKILIVEDDIMLRTIFEMFIEEIGHEHIGTVGSGNKAIDICKTSPPDIILMDIHLDGEINGVETTKIIGDNFNIPVIYISGDSEKDTIEDAVLKNTYGFLTKPLHKETLQVTVDFAIAKHRLTEKA